MLAEAANKTAERAKNSGNIEKYNKYKTNGKIWYDRAAIAEKYVRDISDGVKKAGRDFIIQRDYEVGGLPPFFVTFGKTSTYVEKKK